MLRRPVEAVVAAIDVAARSMVAVPFVGGILTVSHGVTAASSPADRSVVSDVSGDPNSTAETAKSDRAILGTSEREADKSRVEDVRVRMTFFDQRGFGYQSKAGPPEGPGSERLQVWQVLASVGVRQKDERFSHRIGFAADVVTAASPDALDAVSSASRWNEAFTLNATSRFAPERDRAWSLQYGAHLEEHWRTGLGGLGYERSLFEDNTVIAASVNLIYDYFDDLDPRGENDGQTQRFTLNDNLGLTQVLSPTTLLVANYGLTFQNGTLENGWNSVYVSDAPTYGCTDDPEQIPAYDCDNRRRENFPRTRIRHAVLVQINQHIPRSRTTLKALYRFYADDFGLNAHTAEGQIFQWLGSRVYARLNYRYHVQTGVDFFTTSISSLLPESEPATADSDLARFRAHEVGGKLVFYITPPHHATRGAQWVDIGYRRYQRTDGLSMNVISIGFAKEFE